VTLLTRGGKKPTVGRHGKAPARMLEVDKFTTSIRIMGNLKPDTFKA